MAFFDKIGETITSKSKGVAQKAKDLAEVSDLNKQINQCNQKINDSYMEIGYYYYQAHKDDGDDPFAAQCANIRQAMDQADALRAQIQVIKGVKVCPNCHAEIPKDSQFCGYCGCRITPQGQAMPQNSAPYGQADVQQPFGQPQAPGYEQPAPAESQTIPSLEKTQSVVQPEVSPSVCPGCGSPVAEDDVFCGECGRKLK